jgi:hypothetical protein
VTETSRELSPEIRQEVAVHASTLGISIGLPLKGPLRDYVPKGGVKTIVGEKIIGTIQISNLQRFHFLSTVLYVRLSSFKDVQVIASSSQYVPLLLLRLIMRIIADA